MPALKLLRVSVALALLGAGLYAGARASGPVPPLGPFLHPTTGVWAVAAQEDFPPNLRVAIPSLDDSLRVYVDRRAVPHVLARTTDDAWRALGYLHARHRLFQLELQIRATDGTLSELVGARALPLDRLNRRLGIPRSVERDLLDLDSASAVGRALLAYAQGVNARLDELTRAELPLEYRLLSAWPRRWDITHSIVFTKRMGYTLSYSTLEERLERAAELVGRDAALALAPPVNPVQEPIVPRGLGGPRFVDRALPGPALGLETAVAEGAEGAEGAGGAGWPAAASNNWVVSPARSQSGRALLAGDPHLDLTLPSIWYEAHLVVPGALDVHGVTFPGVPFVPIGFNRHVAWSFTNTGNDVVDRYDEVLDDPEAPTAYRLDGAWERLERRIEVYRGPDGGVLATDTVYFTHRGPLQRSGGRARSLRWTVLEGGGVFEPFLAFLSAESVDQWLAAMERYRAPVQNGAVADWLGNIAIASYGRYPVRPGDGSGAVIRDGTTRASDWQGGLPVERQPVAVNPAQGFLASANQQPVDPADDPAYLGAGWPSPWRAMRINALLRADTAVTPDAMRRYQTDPGSARADLFVPFFLDAADRWTGGDAGARRTAAEAAALLREWNRRYTMANERAVLFERAMDQLERNTWDELLGGRGLVFTPGEAVLLQLLRDSASVWWDDRRTPDSVEDRTALLARSLAQALDSVRAAHGPPEDGGWRWDRVSHANIRHLLGFPALSALDLAVQGGPGTLNPIGGAGTHGPSWRMVVELGPDVRAWATYPGGQSGNPVSPWYDDRLADWAAGTLRPVWFPEGADALPSDSLIATFTLHPGTP